MSTLRVLACSLLVSSRAWADMVVAQRVESVGQTQEMTIKLRGDKMRADIAPGISTVRDIATGDMVTLMHGKRTFLRISGATSAALARQVQQGFFEPATALSAVPTATLQPTGRKDTLHGYKLEEHAGRIGNIEVRYWLARDFPNWQELLGQLLKIQQSGLDSALQGRVPKAADFTGMPLLTVTEFNGQTIRTTILSIKEEPVSPAEFEIPAGYTEMTTPALGSSAPAPPTP